MAINIIDAKNEVFEEEKTETVKKRYNKESLLWQKAEIERLLNEYERNK